MVRCECGTTVPDNQKFCNSCGRPRSSQSSTSGPPKKAAPPNPTTRPEGNKSPSGTPCVACGQPLAGGDSAGVLAAGISYHLTCLVCAGCSRKMQAGDRFSLNFKNKPVCSLCVDKCAGCGQPCKEDHAVALDQPWHNKCFVCFTCKANLGKSFYEEAKKPFCSNKCINAFTAKSPAASQPAANQPQAEATTTGAGAGTKLAIPGDSVVKATYHLRLRQPHEGPQRQEFTKGGILEKWSYHGENGAQYEWGVVNNTDVHFNVTFDFSGSNCFDFQGPLKQTLMVKSREAKSCIWAVQQPGEGSKLTMKFNAATVQLAPEEKAARVADETKRVGGQIDAFNRLNLDPKASVDTILAACKKNSVKFVDKEFPPTDSSLFDAAKEGKNPFGDVSWRRASEFLDPGYAVFEGGVLPSDIQQGKLGDCWFMCAVASVAENPRLIQDVFITKDASSEGCYRLRLCIRGQLQELVLDDFFPCYPGAGPMFSRNNGPELWVLLLEKAYAKVHGNYGLLRGGVPACAMQDITGCPAEHYNMDSKEIKAEIASGVWWKRMLDWGQADLIMAAGTPGEDHWTATGVDPKDGPGIVAGHAYTVLHVQEGGGQKLLNIRNPWGRFEWNGRWGDSSPLWTEQMKAIFKPVFADDGCFWMCYEDFLKYFADLNVCYRHSIQRKDWSVDREVLNFALEASPMPFAPALPDRHFELNIPRGGDAHVFAALHQADKRVRGATNIDFGLLICKIEQGKIVDVLADSQLEIDRDCQADVKVPPGKYRVIPYSSGISQKKLGVKNAPVVCSVHLDIKSQGVDYLAPCAADPALLKEALQVQMMKRGDKTPVAPHITQYQYIHNKGASFFLVGLHLGSEFRDAKALEFTLDYSKSKNVVSGHGPLVQSHKYVPGNFNVFFWLGGNDSKSPFSVAGSFSYEETD